MCFFVVHRHGRADAREQRDRVVPRIFLARLPITGAQWLSIGSFVILASLIYASTSFSLAVCSQVFSMAYLLVLGFFPITLFLLKISRPHLARSPQTSLALVGLAVSLCTVLVGGNVALAPTSFAYFAAYFAAVFAMLWTCKELVTLLKLGCWLIDRLEWLRRGRLAAWGPWMVQTVRTLRRPPVCCLVKTDEVRPFPFPLGSIRA